MPHIFIIPNEEIRLYILLRPRRRINDDIGEIFKRISPNIMHRAGRNKHRIIGFNLITDVIDGNAAGSGKYEHAVLFFVAVSQTGDITVQSGFHGIYQKRKIFYTTTFFAEYNFCLNGSAVNRFFLDFVQWKIKLIF